MNTYTIAQGLTVPQNTVKAAIFNGSRILKRELSRGSFESVKGDQNATVTALRSHVKNQLTHVIESVEGEHPDKAELLEKLELWLLTKMIGE